MRPPIRGLARARRCLPRARFDARAPPPASDAVCAPRTRRPAPPRRNPALWDERWDDESLEDAVGQQIRAAVAAQQAAAAAAAAQQQQAAAQQQQQPASQ